MLKDEFKLKGAVDYGKYKITSSMETKLINDRYASAKSVNRDGSSRQDLQEDILDSNNLLKLIFRLELITCIGIKTSTRRRSLEDSGKKRSGWQIAPNAAAKEKRLKAVMGVKLKKEYVGLQSNSRGCDAFGLPGDSRLVCLGQSQTDDVIELPICPHAHWGKVLRQITEKDRCQYDTGISEKLLKMLMAWEGRCHRLSKSRGVHNPKNCSGRARMDHSCLKSHIDGCSVLYHLVTIDLYFHSIFRFLLIGMNNSLRRSNSMERKQRQAKLMKRNQTFIKASQDEEGVMTEEMNDCLSSHESSAFQKSSFVVDQKRKSIDISSEHKNCENDSNKTVLAEKSIKSMPTINSSSQHLENSDDLLVPSDKAELRNMNEIFNCYVKDVDTFKTRKEEFSKDEFDSDFFHSLKFILQ
ncbi:unnamed protein product, partial [Meganyctiphanes norvegica]